MNTDQDSQLRPGNRALRHLFTHFQPMDPNLRVVAESLPKFGDALYGEAKKSARALLQEDTSNPVKRVFEGFTAAIRGKEKSLALSIFDLQLTVCFSEFSKFISDTDAASVLVDALLFQATGFEASSPSEQEVLFLGTENSRGIQKYQLARKSKQHIGDIEAWTFGKEYGAIVWGNANDFAYIVSVSQFSLVARVRARWGMKYLLYNSRPTKQDEEELDAILKKQKADLQKLMDSLSKFKNTGESHSE